VVPDSLNIGQKAVMKLLGAVVVCCLIVYRWVVRGNACHSRLKVATIFCLEIASTCIHDYGLAAVRGVLISALWKRATATAKMPTSNPSLNALSIASYRNASGKFTCKYSNNSSPAIPSTLPNLATSWTGFPLIAIFP
jgi:hypothetical protein